MLLSAGIEGPYGVALSPEAYTGVIETTERGGYPLLDHLKKIVGGPLVWAPGVRGAVVVSLRGGDFLFESGQDLSVGYDSHDADGRQPLPGGELLLPRRDAGGGRRADAVRRRRRRATTARPSSAGQRSEASFGRLAAARAPPYVVVGLIAGVTACEAGLP